MYFFEATRRGYRHLVKGYWFYYGSNYITVIRQKDGKYKEQDLAGTAWEKGDSEEMESAAMYMLADKDIGWKE